MRQIVLAMVLALSVTACAHQHHHSVSHQHPASVGWVLASTRFINMHQNHNFNVQY